MFQLQLGGSLCASVCCLVYKIREGGCYGSQEDDKDHHSSEKGGSLCTRMSYLFKQAVFSYENQSGTETVPVGPCGAHVLR